MAGPSDLHDLCAEWLDACAEAVATTVGGAIGRAYVSPGPPVIDCCPMLAVFAGGPSQADTAPLSPPLSPGHRVENQGFVPLVNMTAVVVRCVPIGGEDAAPPTVAELTASAQKINEDVWAIWNHTKNRYRAGTLFSSLSGKRELFLDPAFPFPPAGGCGGWQMQIRVELGGYKEA